MDSGHAVVVRGRTEKESENSSSSSGLENTERGNWTGKLDFVLSCLSYAVGLGNVWRFPYLCYSNGGGAFLIPYAIMLFLAGLPLFFMELSFGQYASEGPISIWKISPLFKGVGYGMFIVSAFIGIYYNMILAWAIYYVAASFTTILPWSDCENHWNSKDCSDVSSEMRSNCTQHGGIWYKSDCFTFIAGSNLSNPDLNGTSYSRSTLKSLVDEDNSNRKMPSDEYFHNAVLSITGGLHDMGEIKWELALCLLLAWVLVFICLAKGVQSSGKAAYFTATFPYLVLVVLLCRGLTLPGCIDGILFYLTPDWQRLGTAKVWGDAAVQIFFSLSPCWGGLITLASYNKFHNNCLRDAVVVSVSNCATSVFAGLVIFSIIGYMAHELGLPVGQVIEKGPGLAFIAYPEAISKLPGAPIWSIMFFLMLLTLGLGTQFTVVTTVVTTIVDEFPTVLRRYRILVLLGVSIVSYLVGLVFCAKGGMFALQLFDSYVATWSVLIIGFVECFAISWVYGLGNFLQNIQVMLQRPVTAYWFWFAMWKYITPTLILSILIFTWIDFKPGEYGEYTFPSWADGIGWALSFTSVLAIPIVAAWQIFQEKEGSFVQRVKKLLRPTPEWGPALPEHRAEAIKCFTTPVNGFDMVHLPPMSEKDGDDAEKGACLRNIGDDPPPYNDLTEPANGRL